MKKTHFVRWIRWKCLGYEESTTFGEIRKIKCEISENIRKSEVFRGGEKCVVNIKLIK